MKKSPQVVAQRARFDHRFSQPDADERRFHVTTDPLTRYLRDRRLQRALELLRLATGEPLESIRRWQALVVCGGSGGEGIFLLRHGLAEVTVSDISPAALELCRTLEPLLQTSRQDCESLSYPDASFDLVLVQDGLHHLPRPATGLTEMLRVSRRAVVVLEPHTGWVARTFGREWEREGEAVNYVFRWNQRILEQTVKSYLVDAAVSVRAHRMWDHSLAALRIVRPLPAAWRLPAVKLLYGLLNSLLRGAGNQMLGIVVKTAPRI